MEGEIITIERVSRLQMNRPMDINSYDADHRYAVIPIGLQTLVIEKQLPQKSRT